MFYITKTPWLLRKMYADCVWRIPTEEKLLYLSFDDGPHPEATEFVLEQLKKYKARASFFCIGKNVANHPAVYRRILEEGHRTGNHTQNHLNGWKESDKAYFENIRQAANYIDSDLFRPPYGRISHFQIKHLREAFNYKIIMWDVLSADFDKTIDGDRCAGNVISHARPGSIVVFHDSEKAFPRLEKSLPKVLDFFTEKGFLFESIK